MSLEVRLSEAAFSDLASIYQYIVSTDGENRANDVVSGLFAKAESLRQFPNRGTPPKELLKNQYPAVLEIYDAPFRIIYEIMAEEILILAFADMRRDLKSLLQSRVRQ